MVKHGLHAIGVATVGVDVRAQLGNKVATLRGQRLCLIHQSGLNVGELTIAGDFWLEKVCICHGALL